MTAPLKQGWKVYKVQCINGPHKGDWRYVDWTMDSVLMIKAADPMAVKPQDFPSLENVSREVQTSFVKTLYKIVYSADGIPRHLETIT